MGLDPDAPAEYLVAHLEDALARDPRVTEQGLAVRVVEGEARSIVVSGVVLAVSHKDRLAEVLGELLPGVAVRDETSVADYPEGGGTERLG